MTSENNCHFIYYTKFIHITSLIPHRRFIPSLFTILVQIVVFAAAQLLTDAFSSSSAAATCVVGARHTRQVSTTFLCRKRMARKGNRKK
jgi:hypothetical protein